MKAIEKRILLFLGGCIPARLALVWIAKVLPIKYLPYLGLLMLMPAFGFLYLFVTGKRKTGIETQGEPIWWTKFRLIHGLLYLSFAYAAINRNKKSYQILLLDVCLGLGIFFWHHYNVGSFSKIF